MPDHPDPNDAPSLISQAASHFSGLISAELALIKADLRQSAVTGGRGIALLVGAVIVALVGLNVLASALVAWVAQQGLGVGMAALIVGGALVALALILALSGKSRLTSRALAPNRAARSLRHDIDTMKEAPNAR